MSQELRNRNRVNMSPEALKKNNFSTMAMSSGLSASQLLEESPFHHGQVWKLHVPLLYSILPIWLKNILSSWFCPSSFSPSWKSRYLVAIGKYLYRFKNEQSKDPKGTPIDIQRTSARIVSVSNSQNDDMEILPKTLPRGCTAVFKVSVFGKDQYFAVANKEEALTWTNSIQEGRQETITRIMGHSEHTMYPKSWEYFDNLGDEYAKKKFRIKQRLEESNKRNMELTSFSSFSRSGFTGHYG